MTRYRFVKLEADSSAPQFPDMLRVAHEGRVRPLCLCRPESVPVVIVKLPSGSYIVRRMPDSGSAHAPDCEHFEAPAALTGAAEVMGSAIQVDAEEGTTLKLDFSLSKRPGARMPEGEGGGDTVKTSGTKLTLRGFLHYLWDAAQLNRWTPAMEGRRNWAAVYKYINEATASTVAKKSPLVDQLYMPEPFHPDRIDAIKENQTAKLRPLGTKAKGVQPLMVLVGQVKEFKETRAGASMTVKQTATSFYLPPDLLVAMRKRFALEISLWEESSEGQLIVVATFGRSPTGALAVEELALMFTTAQWLPIESTFEAELIEALVRRKRRFIKGMRFNLAAKKPLATALITDVDPATAVYVLPPEATDADRTELDELINESGLPGIVWDVNASALPQLPPPGRAAAPNQEKA